MDLKSAMQQWAEANKVNIPDKPKPAPKPLDTLQQHNRGTGKHALKKYLAIVQFPPSRGGGVVWYKNRAAIQRYVDLNYKVVWL